MAAPKTANINITIGSTEYVVEHKNFTSLTINRTAKDVCDKFELKILDNDAYEIEATLLSGNNDIKISYIDEDMKIYKEFNGFVVSISTSFVDNRNMLSISGFVSTEIADKFEKYSFAWNTVPKFKWSDVLGNANYLDYTANYEDLDTLDQYSVGISQLFEIFKTGFNQIIQGKMTEVDAPEDIVDRIFENDWIAVDKQGNYYIQKYQNLKDGEVSPMDDKAITSEEESDNIVKSNGNYVIPVKIDKIIKLICCGGNFSDLLEKEYTDYKGTAFYKSGYTHNEWYFIKKWFKRMGKFKGLGYSSFDNGGFTLDWCEDELVQSKASFMEFIYNTLLPKCVQKKDGKLYSNFYISFGGNSNNKGTVKLGRIDASKTPSNIPKYIYYGKFENNGTNEGRLTSFSPTLNILTSMITQGTSSPEDADISTINLLGYEGKNERSVSASNKIKNEGKYKINWGIIKVSSAVSYTANKDMADAKINKIFEEAQAQSYRAKATIEGFNKLNPQEYIEIIILPKTSLAAAPAQHHLSGTYFILSIEDTISNGKYSSSLDLIKNVGSIGNTATVETVDNMSEEVKYKVVSN